MVTPDDQIAGSGAPKRKTPERQLSLLVRGARPGPTGWAFSGPEWIKAPNAGPCLRKAFSCNR